MKVLIVILSLASLTACSSMQSSGAGTDYSGTGASGMDAQQAEIFHSYVN